ncbi:MAG TPA: TIM-barrel domain-containing protein, partial [Vicinamibacterales bacterium]|nr:TIM-barrel domain-containing protein [Vicinamibacterales bacterium]
MSDHRMTRRDAVRRLTTAGAAVALGGGIIRGQGAPITIGGRPVEIVVDALSAETVRIRVMPIDGSQTLAIPVDGSLVQAESGRRAGARRDASSVTAIRAGALTVRVTPQPPALDIVSAAGATVQRLSFEPQGSEVRFLLPKGPLLGLGQGGPQFDRKGQTDRMRNGQGGYQLQTHGSRAPIQWLVGTDGWGMFIHHPQGAFDFTGGDGRFTPHAPGSAFDAFIVASSDPAVIMREYARITGLPALPAQWTLGYMQSHRTLSGPEEILSIPKTFREKKLPCDALIYLGTEFTPSGWNTRNGEFGWKTENFPNPKAMIDEIHAQHFKVVL